ncbi:MAG TPA: glycerol-3-phosphate acyltransferase, partial [Candidatus Dormibacteraeota bacterium]
MGGNVAAAAGCAAGYLIGSVPFGLMVGKAVGGLDVRDFGSGN